MILKNKLDNEKKRTYRTNRKFSHKLFRCFSQYFFSSLYKICLECCSTSYIEDVCVYMMVFI